MNTKPERHELLDDLFGDDTPFHEAALDRMLQQVRRRRRTQFVGRAVITTIAILIPTIALLRHDEKTTTRSIPLVEQAQPTRSTLQIVETRGSDVPIVLSSVTTVSMVETAVAPVDEITDERLMSLVGSSGAVIVWHAPHQAELVLASSAEQARGRN